MKCVGILWKKKVLCSDTGSQVGRKAKTAEESKDSYLVSLVHCFCEEVRHAPKDLDWIQSPEMAMNSRNTLLCTCCFAGLVD